MQMARSRGRSPATAAIASGARQRGAGAEEDAVVDIETGNAGGTAAAAATTSSSDAADGAATAAAETMQM